MFHWAIATAGFAITIVIQAGCASPPSDEELIRRFKENRDTFEQLLQMVQAYAIEQVDMVSEDDPDAGPLMRQLGITSVNVEQTYVVFVCGRSFKHGDKGYEFRPVKDGVPARPPGLDS